MKVQIIAFAVLALLALAYALTECPAVDGEEAVSVANPGNCSSFYLCESGQHILTECPDGLEYNQELGVCDWAENANCVVEVESEAEDEAEADEAETDDFEK